MGELKKVFRPELLNRIDEVIVFHKLTKDEIKTIIVDLMMKRLREQMGEHEAAISSRRRRRSCWSTRATTRRWAPARCAARSSASSRIRSRTSCSAARSSPARPSWSAARPRRTRSTSRSSKARPRRAREGTVPADEPSAEADGDEPSDSE